MSFKGCHPSQPIVWLIEPLNKNSARILPLGRPATGGRLPIAQTGRLCLEGHGYAIRPILELLDAAAAVASVPVRTRPYAACQ